MNDDRIVRLLEEIRDGQRAVLEQYQQAVKNQEQSIAMQRSAMSRPRALLAAIAVVIVVVLAITLVLLWYVIRTYAS